MQAAACGPREGAGLRGASWLTTRAALWAGAPLPQVSPPPQPHQTVLLVPGSLSAALSSGDSHVLFFLFFQSLKSDEETESAKDPQNELFEAQGKAWPCGRCHLWPVLGCQAAGHQPRTISWEVPSVGGVPGGPFSWGQGPSSGRPLRSDPRAGGRWLREQLHGLGGPA